MRKSAALVPRSRTSCLLGKPFAPALVESCWPCISKALGDRSILELLDDDLPDPRSGVRGEAKALPRIREQGFVFDRSVVCSWVGLYLQS